jgi:hypothetical protein
LPAIPLDTTVEPSGINRAASLAETNFGPKPFGLRFTSYRFQPRRQFTNWPMIPSDFNGLELRTLMSASDFDMVRHET